MKATAMRPPRRHRRRASILAATEAEHLAWIIGKLAPDERKALAQIVETADLFEAADRQWLLVPADASLLLRLGTFSAALDDLEPDTGDDEPGADDELTGDEAEGDTGWSEPTEDNGCRGGIKTVDDGEDTRPLPGERKTMEYFIAAARERNGGTAARRMARWQQERGLFFEASPPTPDFSGRVQRVPAGQVSP